MSITFKKTSQGELKVYIEVESAAEHKNIEDKLYTHSEYSTDYEHKLSDWNDKKYYIHYIKEVLQGHKSVIFILLFTDVDNIHEFITELNKYFDKYPSEYAMCVNHMLITDI